MEKGNINTERACKCPIFDSTSWFPSFPLVIPIGRGMTRGVPGGCEPSPRYAPTVPSESRCHQSIRHCDCSGILHCVCCLPSVYTPVGRGVTPCTPCTPLNGPCIHIANPWRSRPRQQAVCVHARCGTCTPQCRTDANPTESSTPYSALDRGSHLLGVSLHWDGDGGWGRGAALRTAASQVKVTPERKLSGWTRLPSSLNTLRTAPSPPPHSTPPRPLSNTCSECGGGGGGGGSLLAKLSCYRQDGLISNLVTDTWELIWATVQFHPSAPQPAFCRLFNAFFNARLTYHSSMHLERIFLVF